MGCVLRDLVPRKGCGPVGQCLMSQNCDICQNGCVRIRPTADVTTQVDSWTFLSRDRSAQPCFLPAEASGEDASFPFRGRCLPCSCKHSLDTEGAWCLDCDLDLPEADMSRYVTYETAKLPGAKSYHRTPPMAPRPVSVAGRNSPDFNRLRHHRVSTCRRCTALRSLGVAAS